MVGVPRSSRRVRIRFCTASSAVHSKYWAAKSTQIPRASVAEVERESSASPIAAVKGPRRRAGFFRSGRARGAGRTDDSRSGSAAGGSGGTGPCAVTGRGSPGSGRVDSVLLAEPSTRVRSCPTRVGSGVPKSRAWASRIRNERAAWGLTGSPRCRSNSFWIAWSRRDVTARHKTPAWSR